MTILDQGAAFFFTREELEAFHLTPEHISQQEALSLLFRALRQAGRPIPPHPEIHCFPDPHGVLFFLRPRVEELPSACHFSVTFS